MFKIEAQKQGFIVEDKSYERRDVFIGYNEAKTLQDTDVYAVYDTSGKGERVIADCPTKEDAVEIVKALELYRKQNRLFATVERVV